MTDIPKTQENRRSGGEQPHLNVPRLIQELRSGGEHATHARQQLMLLGDLGLASLLEQSVIDTKTKLGQQIMLEHAIDSLLTSESVYGMLIATDLVKFGEFNIQFGQSIGDEVISLAAQALLNSIRTSHSTYTDGLYLLGNGDYTFDSDAYRIGGDEFAALLRDDKPFSDVDPIAILREKLFRVVTNGRLVDLLNELRVDGFGIRGSVTIIDPTVHRSYADIIADADPKVRTQSTFVLTRSPEGILTPKELTVDKP